MGSSNSTTNETTTSSQSFTMFGPTLACDNVGSDNPLKRLDFSALTRAPKLAPRSKSSLKLTFKQADLTRAIKAAHAADVSVTGAEINRQGTIKLIFAGETPNETQAFDTWRAKRDARTA